MQSILPQCKRMQEAMWKSCMDYSMTSLLIHAYGSRSVMSPSGLSSKSMEASEWVSFLDGLPKRIQQAILVMSRNCAQCWGWEYEFLISISSFFLVIRSLLCIAVHMAKIQFVAVYSSVTNCWPMNRKWKCCRRHLSSSSSRINLSKRFTLFYPSIFSSFCPSPVSFPQL